MHVKKQSGYYSRTLLHRVALAVGLSSGRSKKTRKGDLGPRGIIHGGESKKNWIIIKKKRVKVVAGRNKRTSDFIKRMRRWPTTSQKAKMKIKMRKQTLGKWERMAGCGGYIKSDSVILLRLTNFFSASLEPMSVGSNPVSVTDKAIERGGDED